MFCRSVDSREHSEYDLADIFLVFLTKRILPTNPN